MTILITGGTKGIGFAIAEHLAARGEPLVLGYHSDEAAASDAVERLAALGAKAVAVRADVGQIADVARLVEVCTALGGGPLHIVHSAASIYPTPLLLADLGAFTRAIQTNGLSLLYLVQTALPLKPWDGGAARVTWSDGVHTLTWNPGVQLTWVDGPIHRMCARSGGHRH